MEEETQQRIKELVEERVLEVMDSDSVKQSLNARLVEERKILEQQVCSSCKHSGHFGVVASSKVLEG